MSIQVKDVSHYYDPDYWILKDINLEFMPGQITSVFAPSGYGKSTLVHIMGGLMKPIQGHVYVDGQDIKAYKQFKPVQIIHQHPEKSINPRWKVGKILNEAWQVTPEIKEMMGIEDFWLQKWPNELSGGELQRVCIARSLSDKVKYLITDEMTSMVDAITQVELLKELQKLVKTRNLGLIFISHDKELIHQISDQVIDLQKVNQ